MTLDAWQYGDPERVLIRKQEEEARQHRACGKCVHRQVLELENKTLYGCAKRRDYGWRCKSYRTIQIFNQPKESK